MAMHPYITDNVSSPIVSNWFVYADNVTGGIFGMGIIISFFFMVFLSFKRYSTDKAILVSLFLTALIATFCRLLEIVSTLFMWLWWLSTAIAFVYLLWGEKSS